MNTSNLSTPSIAANPIASHTLFVPCVPISISFNLVAANTLAKKLSATVLEISPALVKTSFTEFAEIQREKTALRSQIEECVITNEALLDVCLLNIEDLFSHLAAYLMAKGQVAEISENQNAQVNAQISIQRVHDYASAIGLVADDYCQDGIIYPEMLFEACMNRVTVLQKRWKDNSLQSIELGLQLQKDAVFGAAASCLSEICQDGLDNQVTLEPTPLAQEDALGALATCLDFPFCGEWPQLRDRGIVSNRQGNAGNADGEGGVQ